MNASITQQSIKVKSTFGEENHDALACLSSLDMNTAKMSKPSGSATPIAHSFLQSKYTFSSLPQNTGSRLKSSSFVWKIDCCKHGKKKQKPKPKPMVDDIYNYSKPRMGQGNEP